MQMIKQCNHIANFLHYYSQNYATISADHTLTNTYEDVLGSTPMKKG